MKKILVILQIAFYQFVVGSSYYLCFYVGRHFGFDYTVRNLESIVIFTPYIIIFSLFLFLIYRLYDIEIFDLFEAFLNITLSTFLILIFGFALSFFVRAFALPRTVLLFSFPVQFVLLLIVHFLFKKACSSLFKIGDALFIASKGTNHDLDLLRESLHIKNLHTIYEGDFHPENFQAEDKANVSLVIVDDSIPSDSKARIVGFFTSRSNKVLLIPSLYEIVINGAEFRHVNDLPLFEITPIEFDTLQLIVKRIIDLAISIVALVVFSPLLLVISILILIDSGRPIFYLQDRVGLNGKVFKLIKFRTMIKDAEKDTGPILSSESDPRITKIGRFLRKTGFDEIPQFFNVLKGNMSIVGPRPERPELMKEILKKAPEFDLRLKVKPGITGFAQLYGRYDTDFEKKLKMDLLYMKQRNIILTDIYIIFNTLKLFVSPHKRK